MQFLLIPSLGDRAPASVYAPIVFSLTGGIDNADNTTRVAQVWTSLPTRPRLLFQQHDLWRSAWRATDIDNRFDANNNGRNKINSDE